MSERTSELIICITNYIKYNVFYFITMSYYDDIFDPTLANDLDPPIKKTTDDSDNGFYTEKKSYIDAYGIKRKYMLEYYISGEVGSLIRDAISGVKYKNMYVGSANEDKFFKIKMVHGTKSVTLFYSRPQDYEIHQRVKLSPFTIQKWNEKQL